MCANGLCLIRSIANIKKMYQKDIYRVYIQEQIRQNICKIYVQGCPNKIECIPRVVHGWTYALTLTYFTYYELNLKNSINGLVIL
jgi:hypothetical protein